MAPEVVFPLRNRVASIRSQVRIYPSGSDSQITLSTVRPLPVASLGLPSVPRNLMAEDTRPSFPLSWYIQSPRGGSQLDPNRRYIAAESVSLYMRDDSLSLPSAHKLRDSRITNVSSTQGLETDNRLLASKLKLMKDRRASYSTEKPVALEKGFKGAVAIKRKMILS